MKTILSAAVGLLVSVCLIQAASHPPSKGVEAAHPLANRAKRAAALAGLEKKLKESGVFASLPRGVSIYFDADEEPEDGWYMVTVRQINGPGSGGDPNVSPALAHFYVRESDGVIEWYDVVEDERRPFADFVKDRNAP